MRGFGMVKSALFFAMCLCLLPIESVEQNVFVDVEARISKSGYVVSFTIDSSSGDSKDLSINFNGLHLRDETIDKDNYCSISLYANTGILEYDGYRNLDLIYNSIDGETYVDSISLLGFNWAKYSVENNMFQLVYAKEKGIPILTDEISVIENENIILPSDLPTEANRLFYVDCSKDYLSFLEYELRIGKTEYPLDLVYDWGEKMFCLNCSNIQMMGEEGIVEGALEINYFQYFHTQIIFSETFLVQRVLADRSNEGYKVDFGVYDA